MRKAFVLALCACGGGEAGTRDDGPALPATSDAQTSGATGGEEEGEEGEAESRTSNVEEGGSGESGTEPEVPGPDVEPQRLPFTIIMVPDTQYTVQNWPEHYFAQVNWIVDNVDALDIAFVVHVGDLQETAYRLIDWQNAAEGLDYLQGVVPYSVAIGNHDFDAWADGGDPHQNIANDRSSSMFNQYVPRSRMTAYHTYGGSLPADANDNGYHVLAAGGTDWLILTLKYHPTADEIAWGRAVVEAHPDHQVIIVTHEYLDRMGGPTSAGLTVWDGIGKLYPNVRMILSGHLTGANRNVAIGDAGNEVHEILADYQSTENEIGNSYLRIMQFDPLAGTVSTTTYSPAFDEYLVGDTMISCDPWECPVTGGHEFVLEGLTFPVGSGEWWTTRDDESCLDIESASTANGARLIAYECTGGANQQWQVRDAGKGYSHLWVRHSNKCLNVTGSSLDDGAEVIVWTCGPEHNTQWTVEDVEGGWTRFVARHSGKCLERGKTGFVQATCSDSTRQHFLRTPF
jgi:hypothetical protein